MQVYHINVQQKSFPRDWPMLFQTPNPVDCSIYSPICVLNPPTPPQSGKQ